MNMGQRPKIGVALMTLSVVWGCAPGGFVITPVSTHRDLVETEISRDSFFASDKIVLIDVSGILGNAPKQQLLGEGEHAVSLLVEQLDKAKGDPRVKAAILRINSPGGTVVASELMHDEILQFKKSGKPIVAVMMDVAASGGYYIACACDDIAAQPSTITGSIGVIMQMFNVNNTMQMLGISSDAITSGALKDAGSPLRDMKAEERELFQQIVNEMYGRFVDVIVAGRPGLDEAEVRRLGDGRVYTAKQALEHGLIDRVAPMRDVIELAKRRAGSKSTRLVTYHRPMGYRPNYYASHPQRFDGGVNLINIDLASVFEVGSPRFMYLWTPTATMTD